MRRPYLDNIRWAAVLLVVIYHTFYLFNACGVLGNIGAFAPVQYQDAFLTFVYPWFMMLLFAVAGMSARYSLQRRSHREFLRSRTAKLLVPSTLGLPVFHWLTGWFYMSVGGGLELIPAFLRYPIAVLSGSGHLWFLHLLWLYSLLLVLLRRLDKNDRFYALCGKLPPFLLPLLFPVLWGGAQLGNVPVITVYRIGAYLTAFLLGYYFLSHDSAQEHLQKLRLPLLLAALTAGIFYTWRYFGQDYTAAPLLRNLFTNLYAWFMILAVLGCCKAWADKSSPFIDFLRRSSFGVYIFHYLPMVLCSYALKTFTVLPPAAVYLFSLLAGLAGGLALWALFRRIPVARFLLLGLRSPKPAPQNEAS